MKTFELNVAIFIACIYCASLIIGTVLGTPEKHTAADGRSYLIETELKVIYRTNPCILFRIFIKNLQQLSSTTGSKPLMNVNDLTANWPLSTQ